MKVIMISGSIPPESCGVGDYTSRLCSVLSESQVDIELLRDSDLPLKEVCRLRSNAILHIQYPTMGYGKSLYPQLLSLFAKPSVVTLHEFTQAHLLRKIAILPFLVLADKLVFTTHYELNSLAKLLPLIKKKSVVIPLAAAVSPNFPLPPVNTRDGFSYFGLIRPKKGLEEFVSTAREIHKRFPDMPIRIIGAVPERGENYLRDVAASAADIPIDWCLNKPLDEVSTILASCKYAYLYYPDGLSERRSSFMAAISHGIVVFSNSGAMTTQSLKEGYIAVSNPDEVLTKIQKMESSGGYANYQDKTLKAADNYTWERVVVLHKELYKSLGSGYA